MNLTRVLNNALPELPARTLSNKAPRIPPDMVFKEQIENGERIFRVVVAGKDAMYRFPPSNWALIQLFDGQRTYEEIAELYSQQTGHQYSTAEVREFSDLLESADFWYKTPQEKNVQLMQKTAEERRKLVKSRKSRYGDLSEIAFPAVNPDKFVTWLYERTRFVYTWWFSVLTVVAFSLSIGISVAHWDEIGRDTLEFFTFTNKTAGDVFVFYVLALVTLCWHELGHAHACKHYGGRVPAMGFLLIYLTPAFFTDTSEGFVKGTRYQRFIIAMAGAFSELYICAVATPVWWATPPGSELHNSAYLLMLMTGIAGLLINWNPLMKLDGYYMLSEVLGVTDLKENSTAYVSAWVKRHIWRLPVEVPYVARQWRSGYAVYALLSGAYSYTVLYIVARFVGNVFRNFNPEWSFLPELATAGLIFRSRIVKLVKFMQFVYLDKKDRWRELLLSWRGLAIAASIAILLVVPIWRESADGKCVLEPIAVATVRNTVAGTVSRVMVEEGMLVSPGTPLVELRNTPLQSKVAMSEAGLAMAGMKASEAGLRYRDLGLALAEREQMARQNRELERQARALLLESPISGTVLTARLADRLGESVGSGTELVEIADLREMRARVYVSDHDMSKVVLGAPARMSVEGIAKLWKADVGAITPVSSRIDPAVAEAAKYKGLDPLNFYVVDLSVDNRSELLKPGMTGVARIYGERRSLAAHFAREAAKFFSRKLW